MKKQQETVVISVGGSLIAPPSGIDTAFLKRFETIVSTHTKKGVRFAIITGGGATARSYQSAGAKVAALAKEDLDWLGIHATRLNGHLLRSLFRKSAYPVLITNPTKLTKTTKPVLIAAGWKPGWSTDYVATMMAKELGATKLINLSNIDYVYTKDPNKFKDATPLPELSWKEFMKLIPKKWDPGIHTPFDPVASKEAAKAGIEVAMINGASLGELQKYLTGKTFKGTRIH